MEYLPLEGPVLVLRIGLFLLFWLERLIGRTRRVFLLHQDAEQLVHVLFGSFLHMERNDLLVVNCALFKNSEEVNAILEELITSQHVAKVLRHLNDYFLDREQDNLLLVGVMSVKLALEHGLEEEAGFERASARLLRLRTLN